MFPVMLSFRQGVRREHPGWRSTNVLCPHAISSSSSLAFFEFPDSRIFTGCGCQLHAQPSTWRTRLPLFVTPGDRVTQVVYPQALGTHFSRVLRHLRWDSSYPPVTTQTYTYVQYQSLQIHATCFLL
jgi:hypothetical protein